MAQRVSMGYCVAPKGWVGGVMMAQPNPATTQPQAAATRNAAAKVSGGVHPWASRALPGARALVQFALLRPAAARAAEGGRGAMDARAGGEAHPSGRAATIGCGMVRHAGAYGYNTS
eukprot:scaffold26424_cov134-Isochrysis_galbana.AAC.1